jgi:hypothetical protein
MCCYSNVRCRIASIEKKKMSSKQKTNKTEKKNKQYCFNKTVGKFLCCCHALKFDTRSEVMKHAFQHRKEKGTLTEYDKRLLGIHRGNSRASQHEHPSSNIGKEDCRLMMNRHEEQKGMIQKIEEMYDFLGAALSSEERYRSKFSKLHLATLEKWKKDKTLGQKIMTRLEKGLRKVGEDNGYQCSFVKDPIDVARHTTYTCCRFCLYLSAGIPLTRDMTDEEMNYIFIRIWTYLTVFITPGSPMETWMTRIDDLDEMGLSLHVELVMRYLVGNAPTMVPPTYEEQKKLWYAFLPPEGYYMP